VDARAAATLLLTAACLAACGSDTAVEPMAVDVRVVYVSRLPAGCPDIGNPCYPMCAHRNAPAGLQVVVPLWGADSVRLTETSTGRYEGVLAAVPRTRLSASTGGTSGCAASTPAATRRCWRTSS
jgi:hypothetical protein